MIAADQAIERVLPLPMRYAFSGVRPSSGAACSASAGLLNYGGASGVSDVAAPEDGRTPLNRYPIRWGDGRGEGCLRWSFPCPQAPLIRSEERRVGKEC